MYENHNIDYYGDKALYGINNLQHINENIYRANDDNVIKTGSVLYYGQPCVLDNINNEMIHNFISSYVTIFNQQNMDKWFCVSIIPVNKIEWQLTIKLEEILFSNLLDLSLKKKFIENNIYKDKNRNYD